MCVCEYTNLKKKDFGPGQVIQKQIRTAVYILFLVELLNSMIAIQKVWCKKEQTKVERIKSVVFTFKKKWKLDEHYLNSKEYENDRSDFGDHKKTLINFAF